MTPHRRAVLEVVRESHDHPTAEQVLQRLRRTRPGFSLATVYRSLGALVRGGVLVRHELARGPVRYDAVCTEHPHVVCVACGALADVHGLEPALALVPGEVSGFKILGPGLSLRGLCPRCRGGP